MKKNVVIVCALAAVIEPASAGSRTGGSGATAVTIPADALLDGGGSSSGGSGANAVVITAGIGGIGGTLTVATTSNQQGYIPQILPAPAPPLTGYDLWASQNIPAGRDATFAGDWDRDGISNGVAYALGSTVLEAEVTPSRWRTTFPATIPDDVNLYLDRSLTLGTASWVNIVKWENGAAPTVPAGITGVTIQARIRDDIPTDVNNPKAFYRFRAVPRS